MKVEIKNQRDPHMEAKDMETGQVARVTSSGSYTGQTLLRHFEGIVSLDDPKLTWGTNCTLEVELLDVGTQITLTVED